MAFLASLLLQVFEVVDELFIEEAVHWLPSILHGCSLGLVVGLLFLLETFFDNTLHKVHLVNPLLVSLVFFMLPLCIRLRLGLALSSGALARDLPELIL